MRRGGIALAMAVVFWVVPEAKAQTYTWAGVWDTTYGVMVLKQKGNEVTGTYNYDTDKSEIVATASGNTLKGIWDERPSSCDTGEIFFTMSPDGLSFDGTWGPGCGSGGSWKGTRTHIGIPLQITVKTTVTGGVGPTGISDGPERKSVEATVTNLGDEPIEGVQVRGVSVKRITTTCGKDPIKFPKSGAGGGGGTTLAPGQSISAAFEYKEECPGSAKATVRAIAAQGVNVNASTQIKVSDTAYITGSIVFAEAGLGKSMTAEDQARLYKGLRIRAVGKKKTLTERPTLTGAYSMKVPNSALGKYEVSLVGNKAAESIPERTTVTAVRGKKVQAENLELGYACDEDPLGMTFTPVNGEYLAEGADGYLDLTYRCRSQRALISYLTFAPQQSTSCVRADGSTYELHLSSDAGGSPLLSGDVSTGPLTNGQFTVSIPTRIKSDEVAEGLSGTPAQVTGSFTGSRAGTLQMSHPECSGLNRTYTLTAAD